MTKTIYLAGGCFWGMQKFFDQFAGVLKTEVGYANGPDRAPTYQEVCADSGHAETVRIDYDPEIISLTQLLTGTLCGTGVTYIYFYVLRFIWNCFTGNW